MMDWSTGWMIFFTLFFLLLFVFWVVQLVSMLTSRMSKRDKGLWLIAFIVASVLTAIVYYFVKRK